MIYLVIPLVGVWIGVVIIALEIGHMYKRVKSLEKRLKELIG